MPTKKSNRKPPQSQEIASLRAESKRLQQENDAEIRVGQIQSQALFFSLPLLHNLSFFKILQ